MEWVDSYEIFNSERVKYKEHNDCVVIGFAIALNTSYEKAHKHIKQTMNRKNRCGTYYVADKLHTTLKKTEHRVGPYTKKNKITIKKFCEKHPQGRYFVCVSGHALAIIDGVIYDYKDGPRRFVDHAIRIYLEGEI